MCGYAAHQSSDPCAFLCERSTSVAHQFWRFLPDLTNLLSVFTVHSGMKLHGRNVIAALHIRYVASPELPRDTNQRTTH
jgi:hypothetical protein